MLLQDFTALPVRPSIRSSNPQRFRGGRSATEGLTFIPCPHWVLRPHLNRLTLWGPSKTFFSTKTTNGQFYNLLTCANLCQKPHHTPPQYFLAHLTSCNLSSNKCKQTTGNSSAFLGPNFTSLIAFGIEIREARACVALSQPCSLAIKEFMGSLSRKWDHFSSAAPRLQRILLVFWGESRRPEAYSIHHLGRGSHIPADLSASSVGELNK